MASVVGLYTGEDVILGTKVLNSVDENSCAWVITDLDGWWGLPSIDVPSDSKPHSEDGDYYTTGRYLAREVSMRGHILPLDGNSNKTVAARKSLNTTLSPLVRQRTLFSVAEEDATKVSMVQISGQPLTRINQATGLLEFDIVLRCTDPAKYSSQVHDFSTTLGGASPGRVYNREFVYSYGGATSTNTISAENVGNYATAALLTINGPVTKPKIEHVESGKFLEFDIVLGVGESLVINTRTKSVVFSGASRRTTLTDDSRWFALSPGNNTLRYSGVQQIPAQDGTEGGTNWATNPSFESSSAPREIRRNYAPNPGPRSSLLTGYLYQNGTGESTTVLRDSTIGMGAEGRTGFITRTIVTPKTGGTSGIYYRATQIPTLNVQPGEVYTISMWVKFSHSVSVTIGVRLYQDATANTSLPSSPARDIPANEWVRLTSTVSTTTNAWTGFQMWPAIAPGSILPVGGTMSMADVQLEAGSVATDYFDGSTYKDADYVTAWIGTANASPSTLSYTPVVTQSPTRTEMFTNYAKNPNAIITLNGFGSYGSGVDEVGTTSLLTSQSDGPTEFITSYARRTTTTPKSSASTGWSAISSIYRATWEGTTGQTVTVSVWLRYSGPSTLGVRLRAATYSSSGSAINSIDGPNVTLYPGVWTKVTQSVVATTGFSSVGWWAYQISTQIPEAGSTYDCAAVSVTEGQDIFFSGSTPNRLGETYQWTGTANASASTLTRLVAIPGGTQSSQWSRSGTKSLRVASDSVQIPVRGPSNIVARYAGQSAYVGTEYITSTEDNQTLVFESAGILTLGSGWWDNFADGLKTYFDGSYPSATWTGTPNESTSTSPFVASVPKTMLQLSYRDAWID